MRKASWRHTADTGEVFSIEGYFTNTAPCPSLDAEQAETALVVCREAQVWQRILKFMVFGAKNARNKLFDRVLA